MVGSGEQERYLAPFLEHLLEFCDEVRIRLEGHAGVGEGSVKILSVGRSNFFEHEGRARQELLDFTLAGDPTHVISIDCDEFVSDGALLRRAVAADESQAAAWNVCLQEVWNARPGGVEVRQDGGWAERDVAMVWAPERLPKPLRISDRALACGRSPEVLSRLPSVSTGHTCAGVLHFGWTNSTARAARHARYMEHDGGRFHRQEHLDSILLPDDRIALTGRAWPETWPPERHAEILAHAGVTA